MFSPISSLPYTILRSLFCTASAGKYQSNSTLRFTHLTLSACPIIRESCECWHALQSRTKCMMESYRYVILSQWSWSNAWRRSWHQSGCCPVESDVISGLAASVTYYTFLIHQGMWQHHPQVIRELIERRVIPVDKEVIPFLQTKLDCFKWSACCFASGLTII